jgi:hypothetical protein
LRINTKAYGGKTHYTDSQNSDTTAPSGSCTICSSRFRRPVRKLLDTPSYTFLPQYVLMTWCLVKHRDKFIFTLVFLIFRSQWSCFLRSVSFGPLKHWVRGFEPHPTHVCMYVRIFCGMLSCADRGLAMDRSPVQGVLSECLKGFLISQVNYESKETRRSHT